MLACRTDHLDALALLLRCGDVSRKDSEGSSAMNYAAESDNADAILLLAQAGADVNNPDQYGRTSLHTVCMNDNLAAVQTLLAYHANPNLGDRDGYTPLDRMLQESRKDYKQDQMPKEIGRTIEILRKAGAKTTAELYAQAVHTRKH